MLLDDKLQTNSVWACAGAFLDPPDLRQKRDSGGNAGQAKLAPHQVGAFQGLFGTNTHTPCADILGFTPQHFRTRPRPIGSGDLSYL